MGKLNGDVPLVHQPSSSRIKEDKMTEQELTYNLNQELRCCASGFHSIHESRLAILALIKEAGYVKPPESMEITELATILYNFMKDGIQDYNSIKANIQSFLLANHYVKLADEQERILKYLRGLLKANPEASLVEVIYMIEATV